MLDLDIELNKYLAFRRAMGQRTDQIGPRLRHLVSHLKSKVVESGDLCATDILEWVCAGDYSASTKHVRLSAARVFLKYLKVYRPEIEVPRLRVIESRKRSNPFVFSTMQLSDLLNAAKHASSSLSITPMTLETILGLMASTGIRPGEALRLQTSQVFLDDAPPRLLILESKFKKTRWVPIHETAVTRLRSYVRHRDQLTSSNECFFLTKKGKPINRITLWRIFYQLVSKSKIQPEGNQLRPSPHSLRHTFAVNRLRRWYEEGADIASLLPNLSVYLGHSNPSASYWYMTCTPELMAAASALFEHHAMSQKEARHET